VGSLNGPIDTNGYCAYPGIPGPGFSLDNTDGNGNQNPSAYYTLVMTAYTPNASNGPPAAAATSKPFIEPPWFFFPTKAVVCYMQVFPRSQPGAQDVINLVDTIQDIEGAFHPNLLGVPTVPFEVQTTADWAT